MKIGVEREDFLENFFEKKFLFAKGAFSGHGVEWVDIDDALFSWSPDDGLIQLYKNGRIPVEEYVEHFDNMGLKHSRISKEIFYSYLIEGATLVLNRLDTKSPSIHRLTLDVAKFVGEKAVANGYLAFGGEGTFGKHWDTHDVFAVQLIGRKRWRVYEPTFQLPLPQQKSKNFKHQCPVEPVFDGILEQGDALYIPRGWWHEAIPLENEETVHIAVGIHTLKVIDYLNWLCNSVVEQELSFRKTLKFEKENQKMILIALKNLESAWIDPENHRAFKDAQIGQERVNSAFHLQTIVGRQGAEVDSLDDFYLNSVYRRSLDGASRVKVNGVFINIDSESSSVMNAIITGDACGLDDLSLKIKRPEGENIRSLVAGLHRHDVVARKRERR
ncbi:cupin domain-containing protein [Acidovorax sp. GBBC 3334]|uniref:cupin domain-containing protein n=1 Tax=Acidovorax sp. GBBC 3334 TaxID=2940496 RepID=UPI002303DFDE|nr:cupin domain-containing protein [Acidovorax sp. GBBC 3334]MDA8455137.1 cupin domain-containing protein [Acidovorax sp. GBBC 3334]